MEHIQTQFSNEAWIELKQMLFSESKDALLSGLESIRQRYTHSVMASELSFHLYSQRSLRGEAVFRINKRCDQHNRYHEYIEVTMYFSLLDESASASFVACLCKENPLDFYANRIQEQGKLHNLKPNGTVLLNLLDNVKPTQQNTVKPILWQIVKSAYENQV